MNPATAWPNTSLTTAIRLWAIATGQNVGTAKMTMAPSASNASARTIAPRFGGLVNRRTDGRLDRKAKQAADGGHQADLGLPPALLRDQKHVKVRSERSALGEETHDAHTARLDQDLHVKGITRRPVVPT